MMNTPVFAHARNHITFFKNISGSINKWQIEYIIETTNEHENEYIYIYTHIYILLIFKNILMKN